MVRRRRQRGSAAKERSAPTVGVGSGVGASHQTGWTGLVAKLIQQQGELS